MAVPIVLYGTAWKHDATTGLVELGVRAGYRAIETANQKNEDGSVGAIGVSNVSPTRVQELLEDARNV